MVAYSASKGAVISFTRSLALELGEHGITVNNIPPNFIETPMLHKAVADGRFPPGFIEAQVEQTPVKRSGRPEDIAAICAFLVSPEAGYVTAQTIGVNGGRFP
jgi:NAD(P)-dependent dehydrogenase (short-subunit alcohol dehydrogenase family)